MRRRRVDDDASEITDECAAFLTGKLVERWEEKGLAIPVWAWTNLLAHGNETSITESVSRPQRHRLLTRRWWIARAELATVVLDITHLDCSLVELQESVLIPLELDLASCPEVSFWNHRQWIDAVARALHHHNHTRQSA
jgi:hypothetical protein